MKSIKELVAKYGSQQKLADAMGVHRPQVSRWVKLDAHIDEDGGVYIKTRSVNPVKGATNEWCDIAAKALAVLQVNGIPLIGDYPERCLWEIQADAGRAGFVEGAESMKLAFQYGGNYSTEAKADEYAAKVRQGGE